MGWRLGGAAGEFNRTAAVASRRVKPYVRIVDAQSYDADVVIAGGGLSAGLIALRLARARPDLRITIVERGGSLGVGHTWSFFESDVAPESRAWVERLASHVWPGYTVRFPQHGRRLATPYRSIPDARLHQVIAATPGVRLLLGREAVALAADHVRLADGAVVRAAVVIDARGPDGAGGLKLGYQKFVGLEVETAAPHGLVEPVVMDATVPQKDGYRFVYLLPFSPTRLLIEDTRYADGAALDHDDLAADARAYAAAQGWTITRTVRVEHGVLPVALAGDIRSFWDLARRASPAARVGLRAALFHPTTGYSLPDAVRTAEAIAGLRDLTTATVASRVEALSVELWDARGFYRLLDRMLFRAAAPTARYKVLQRFYRLPEPLIRRFYAAENTTADKLRILSGRPPVPLGAAMACLSETRLLCEAA